MPTDFKPPVQVSPLIRGVRWGLLLLGIFYGVNKKIFYTEVEKMRRESERRREISRDECFAEESVSEAKDSPTTDQPPTDPCPTESPTNKPPPTEPPTNGPTQTEQPQQDHAHSQERPECQTSPQQSTAEEIKVDMTIPKTEEVIKTEFLVKEKVESGKENATDKHEMKSSDFYLNIFDDDSSRPKEPVDINKAKDTPIMEEIPKEDKIVKDIIVTRDEQLQKEVVKPSEKLGDVVGQSAVKMTENVSKTGVIGQIEIKPLDKSIGEVETKQESLLKDWNSILSELLNKEKRGEIPKKTTFVAEDLKPKEEPLKTTEETSHVESDDGGAGFIEGLNISSKDEEDLTLENTGKLGKIDKLSNIDESDVKPTVNIHSEDDNREFHLYHSSYDKSDETKSKSETDLLLEGVRLIDIFKKMFTKESTPKDVILMLKKPTDNSTEKEDQNEDQDTFTKMPKDKSEPLIIEIPPDMPNEDVPDLLPDDEDTSLPDFQGDEGADSYLNLQKRKK